MPKAEAAADERVEQTRIVSRYNVAREVEALERILAQMRWEDRRLVEEVIIDSKATWLVQVTLREGDANDVERVANSVEAGMMAEVGGHNGIAVVGPGDQVFVPGCWAVSAASNGG